MTVFIPLCGSTVMRWLFLDRGKTAWQKRRARKARGSEDPLGTCPRKKSLKDNVLEPRRGDFKISHFLETRVLTGDQNFLEFLENP